MNLLKLAIVPCFVLLTTCQPRAQVSDACGCEDVFDQMVEKLEANYIGHTFLTSAELTGYAARVDSFRVAASTTDPKNCTAMMEQFLQFFGDGHLFVVEYPDFPEDELATIKGEIKDRRFDVAELLHALPAESSSVSGIEGVWTDGDARFAVIKNKHPDWAYEYVAVILTGPDDGKIGEVKIAVDWNGHEYEGVYYSNAYAPRYVTLSPAKDYTLLNIRGGFLWGRVPNSGASSIDSAPTHDPKTPKVVQLSADVTLLTIPTFLIDKGDFDGVLKKNAGLLLETRNLVIDIRGNSGGNGIYFDLLRLYSHKTAHSEIGRALASQDNLAYFKRFAGGGADDPYAPVVADMENNIGSVVSGPRFKNIDLDPMDSEIERVIIVTDEANKSAAETFVLYSKMVSDKVTVIGTNTGGVVDYNNVNMVKLDCERYGTHFGYPMYTRTPRVPEEGYNGIGIEPDVRVPDTASDVISYVLDYLGK